jgi:hypothetical protein
VETEGRTNHCVLAASGDSNTSDLLNPRAYTPLELRRMLMCQIKNRREVHVLAQRGGGVLETIVDFAHAQIPRRDFARSARETGELIEISDAFYFQTPAE